MNLAGAFTDCAHQHAQKIAIYSGEQEISFAELEAQSLKFAVHLQNHFAVKPGDRVGLWLKNCPEFVVAVFGILHVGAVVVPINNFLKPAEVGYLLNDAGIDILISDAELGAHFPALSTRRKSQAMAERLNSLTSSSASVATSSTISILRRALTGQFRITSDQQLLRARSLTGHTEEP